MKRFVFIKLYKNLYLIKQLEICNCFTKYLLNNPTKKLTNALITFPGITLDDAIICE